MAADCVLICYSVLQTVAEVVGASDVTRSAPGGNATHYGSLNVSALFIGYNKVRVTLFDRQDVVRVARRFFP